MQSRRAVGSARTLMLAAVIAAGGIRLARSRHRRSLHPAGRSFGGTLEVYGLAAPVGAGLIDRPSRHRVTIRLSKGIGTRGSRPDVLGVAIRIHDDGPDLLLSTMGSGRASRHVPALRRGFDVGYGSITSYRTGSGTKVYLSAVPDPDRHPLGPTLESVVGAGRNNGAGMLLSVDTDGSPRVFGRVTFGTVLAPAEDADLTFDPVRRASAELHPSGTVHGIRAFAYRLSQRWRGATPVPANPAGVLRTAVHR
jgi:hypothetical protein